MTNPAAPVSGPVEEVERHWSRRKDVDHFGVVHSDTVATELALSIAHRLSDALAKVEGLTREREDMFAGAAAKWGEIPPNHYNDEGKRNWWIGHFKYLLETAEAALREADGLLREARQYLDIIGKPTMVVTRCDAEALAKRIDTAMGVKS